MALIGAQYVQAVDPNPVGSLQAFAGANAPTGWLLCDGSQQPIATYPELYSVLSTTYGALTNGSGGAGSSHFRVPDLRGRMPVGAGNDGTAANNATRTRGDKGGDTRLQSHFHDGTMTTGSGATGGPTDAVPPHNSTVAAGQPWRSKTQGDGGAQNMPPFLVTNYIIKATSSIPRGGTALGSTPPIVTALPVNPQFGEVVTYAADATNGAYWTLQFDGGGTYPWKFIGGAPLSRGDTGSAQEQTNSTSYATTTNAPALTVPRAGNYTISFDLEMGYVSGGPGGANTYATVKLGSAAASDDNCVVMSQASSGLYTHVARSIVRTLAASDEVKQFYKAPGGTTIGVLRRYLSITPVRVS
jgi:microcystin-dependent protein